MEIWRGVWACAAATCLGLETAKVRIAKDRYPGSGDKGIFEEKYGIVEGVWGEV